MVYGLLHHHGSDLMRHILHLVTILGIAFSTAATVQAQALTPSDRDWAEVLGWKVYWNERDEGCFAEQIQLSGTRALLGVFGKENLLAIGFQNDKLGFAKKDERYEMVLRFDRGESWTGGLVLQDFGGGAFLGGAFNDAAKFRATIMKSGKLTILLSKKALANISLKGSSAALKAVDECRIAMRTRTSFPQIASKKNSAAIAEAAMLESDALALQEAGKYLEAEPLHRRVLEIREAALGGENAAVSAALNNLANTLTEKGDLDGAEPLYRRALEIDEKVLGPDHVGVAADMNNLANVVSTHDERDWLYRRALEIREKALGPEHPDVASSLDNLATMVGLEEAERLYRRALAIRENALGLEHPALATSFNNLASVSRRKGDLEAAELFHRRALKTREKLLGPHHPDVAQSLNNLSFVLHERGVAIESLSLARRAAEVGHPSRGPYLSALFAVGAEQTEVIDESFTVVQQTAYSDAEAALRSLALRASLGSEVQAGIIRNEQDLAGELRRLESAILTELAKEPARRNHTKEAFIREQTANTTVELAAVRKKLTSEFPDYAELNRPTVLGLSEVQKLLSADEALVVLDVAGRGKGDDYVWAVTRDRADWKRIDTREDEIFLSIARLLGYLNMIPDEALGRTEREPIHPAWLNFLFKQLLGPIESAIENKRHLIFVLNGVVSSLPLQVLVKKSPQNDDYRNAHWLVRDHAITVLPTVSSLNLLRGQTHGEKAPMPFRGYGDPVFDSTREGSVRMAALGYRMFFRGGLADIEALKASAPRLPGTARELRAVAASLGAPESEIILREEASEAAVKQAPLADYNILYFATHGLVAGEVEKFNKDAAEPALLLTIPEKATELDDGLLTASEIAQLKLNADWVVLSACNTAAEGKPGAGALSGLARAFFYAGARSLLVSHWYVDDEATAALMSRTFASAAANPGRRQAEALREAMLSVMNDPDHPEWADPGYWAPFILVGEAR
jgi:CHAT domain-containing protein